MSVTFPSTCVYGWPQKSLVSFFQLINIRLPTWHFHLDIRCLLNSTCSKAFLVFSPKPAQSVAFHTLVDNHAFPVTQAKSPRGSPDLPLHLMLLPPHQDILLSLPPKYIQNPTTSVRCYHPRAKQQHLLLGLSGTLVSTVVSYSLFLTGQPKGFFMEPSKSSHTTSLQNSLMVLNITESSGQSPCEGSQSHYMMWSLFSYWPDFLFLTFTLLLGVWPPWCSLSMPGTGDISWFNCLHGSLPYLWWVLAQILSSQPIMITSFI